MSKSIVVLSGGMDSATALYHTMNYSQVVGAVSFNYGQRHKKELEFAQQMAFNLQIPWHLIDLHKSGFTGAIVNSGSSLVTDTRVPEGHYAQDNMKQTIVPNRNMVMISIALAIAVAEEANQVVVGVHAGDHFIYPDCRPEFIKFLDSAARVGNEGSTLGRAAASVIRAPFLHSSKADIAYEAMDLRVPLEKTWSCYKGGEKHCGRCGTCVERLEAIASANLRRQAEGRPVVEVETEYENDHFWMDAIKGGY